MNKISLMVTLVCLGCALAGCAARPAPGESAAAGGVFAGPAPAPPAGTRLGAPYVSALNEPCYELLPAAGPFDPPQALCLRGRAWEVAPSVLAVLPGRIPAVR